MKSGEGEGRPASLAAAWGMAAGAALIALAGVLLVVGFEGRDAFWLDESWTGAIVAQPTWRAAVQQIYWDVNAPLYYVLARLWSGVFGLSDGALRSLSLLAAAATPAVAALAPSPGLTRAQRLGWAALLAFWFPALCYGAEARCYALLLLAATAQTVAFARLMAAPDTGRAAAWAVLAALAILLHYDALYLGAAQGGVYLARHPRRALASWPAALLFAPAFGWLLHHWPRIAEFARPNIAWYAPLGPAELPRIAAYLADGGPAITPWLAAAGASVLSLRLLPFAFPPRPRADAPFPGWAVGASALAAAALVGIGFLRPSFAFRYLTPCEPGLLLGLVWLAGALAGRRRAPAALALLAVSYLLVSGGMLGRGLRMAPRRYSFEAASRFLARSRPARLVFLWDHPVDPILHPGQLAALGGFFLHRAGEAVEVVPVVLQPGEDPSARIAAAAGQAPGSATLWLYDRLVKGTAAVAHPPGPALLRDPTLACRDFGSRRFGVLACAPARPPPASEPRPPVRAHQPG